jgi:hypothetical protein
MTRSVPLLLLALSTLLSAAAPCETDLIEDAGFQLWCGDRLCVWDTEEGEIRKVGTWHTHDYGVELVGAPVLLASPAAQSAASVRIEVVSDIEEGAMVTVEIDRDGDGAIDSVVPIPPSDTFVSRVWGSAGSVEESGVFYVRKAGPAHAVVARLRVSRN